MPKEKGQLADQSGKNSSANLIRFVWTDYCGIVRCKVIPASLLGAPVRMVTGGMVLTPWGPTPPGAKAGPVGEVHLAPVVKVGNAPWRHWQSQPGAGHLSSRLELPWHPNHKIAIAKMVDQSGEPWAQCPKGALMRAVSLLKEKGLNLKAGFELEFVLFRQGEGEGKGFMPLGRESNYGSFHQFDVAAPFMDDVVCCLDEMKIPVRMIHAESGPGQFEIVLGHKDVADALQDLLLARLAIKAVARIHGLVASFSPSYGVGLSGSGSHVHLSIDGHFGTADKHELVHGVSEIGRMFMAGVLEALPWLSFLLMSSPLSYARCQPQCWVGAYLVWGYNNKEAPVRLVEDRTNFEVKLLDGISNADLALAGVLLAGLKGIEGKKVLPMPCQVDPYTVDEKERPARLPQSLEESMNEFKKVYKQGELKDVFLNEMVEDLLCVKRSELEYVNANGLSSFRDLLLTMH